MNNHWGSLWKRTRCQSNFFNRLQLYTESIKLKYLCNGSYFAKRHSLPMNIITVMGHVYAVFVYHSPKFTWTELGLNLWEELFKWFIWGLDRLLKHTCWVFLWSQAYIFTQICWFWDTVKALEGSSSGEKYHTFFWAYLLVHFKSQYNIYLIWIS